MSLKTWTEEYYPVKAGKLEKSGASDLELVDHSLRKWEGVKLVNLKRHGLVREYHVIEEEGTGGSALFAIGFNSCTLCKRFEDSDGCTMCPITEATKQTCCEPLGDSPYDAFTGFGRVGPMLKVLRKARRWCVREEKRDG